ncbi:MAG: hypothetical protein ACYC4S_08450 [Rhodoferax sp.]
MIETKKFIFLSNRQRHVVSFLLGFVLLAAIGLLVATRLWFQDQEIKLLSIDLIKLAVTAWGAWGLILLYASANSFERINKETRNFLERDIRRAFDTSALKIDKVAIDPINEGLKLNLVVQTRNSAVYEFVSGTGFSIHFYCKLNVYDLAILVFLPEAHASNYKNIYETSLKYLEDNGIKVMFMGVFEERWLPAKQKRLQIQILRSLGDDFLFDAARRTYVADLIFGDLRAFLVRAQREDARQV